MTQSSGWRANSNTDSYYVLAKRGRHQLDEDAAGWPERVMESIAQEIRAWRDRREISGKELAARCAELGFPIARNVIANIESGRRSGISVPELIVIAMALNVPPILLIYPIGRDKLVEIGPEHEIAPWFAVKWFIADNRPPAELLGGRAEMDTADAMREWEEAAAVFTAYRRHDSLVRRYRYVRDDMMAEIRRMAEPSPPEREDAAGLTQARVDLLAKDLVRAADAVRRHRQHMRDDGYVLPELPPDVDLS